MKKLIALLIALALLFVPANVQADECNPIDCPISSISENTLYLPIVVR